MSCLSDQQAQGSEAGSREQVQVGARMEKRTVKALKALAEYLDMSMGDLLSRLARD